MIVNLKKNTLSFMKNKKKLGIAFENIKGPLFVAVSG
jgi:hypothetical protein